MKLLLVPILFVIAQTNTLKASFFENNEEILQATFVRASVEIEKINAGTKEVTTEQERDTRHYILPKIRKFLAKPTNHYEDSRALLKKALEEKEPIQLSEDIILTILAHTGVVVADSEGKISATLREAYNTTSNTTSSD